LYLNNANRSPVVQLNPDHLGEQARAAVGCLRSFVIHARDVLLIRVRQEPRMHLDHAIDVVLGYTVPADRY
jgi:hypothetical protein